MNDTGIKAFHKIFMREYLSFSNPRIQIISKAIFNVGIIPLKIKRGIK